MSESWQDVDIGTVRERLEEDAAVVVEDRVVSALEERAVEDGSVSAEAVASWYDDCEAGLDSVEERVADLEARLDGFRESLDPAEREFAHVRARFDEFHEQFESVREAIAGLTDRLDAASRAPESTRELYATADRLSTVESAVGEVHHSLEHVEEEVDPFETWLVDPTARVAYFEEELQVVERYLDNTEELLETIEAHADDPPEGFDPFDAWVAARHLHLLVTVAFEEFRSDVAELARWLDGRDDDADLSTLTDRLDSLETRHESFEIRFDDTADTIDGFESAYADVADDVERFEATLDDLEPPIDWTALEERLNEQFDTLGIERP
jgi:septation ring formation regulator EzrA